MHDPLATRGPDWRTKFRALAARLGRSIGHRGAFLLFLAVLDISYGYSLEATAAPQRLWDLFLPWEWWGGIWIAVGAACAVSAFLAADRVAFAAAGALKTGWAAVMADVWLFQEVPRGWVSAIVFGCFALAVLDVASWPEPVRL